MAFNPPISEAVTYKTSRFEILTRKALTFYLDKYVPTYNERPDFLKNEETGRNFELDIWYKELGIAIEVNGIAHILKKAMERDAWKFSACKRNDIRLFSIKNGWQIFDLIKKLRARFLSKGNFYLAEKLKHPLPVNLKREICSYRPSKTAFGNLYKRIKYKKHLEEVYDKQKEEKDSIIRRRLAKENKAKSWEEVYERMY